MFLKVITPISEVEHLYRYPSSSLAMSDMPSTGEKDWEKHSDSIVVPDALENQPDDNEPMPVDPRVRRKVDFNLIPLISLLYLCSFL